MKLNEKPRPFEGHSRSLKSRWEYKIQSSGSAKVFSHMDRFRQCNDEGPLPKKFRSISQLSVHDKYVVSKSFFCLKLTLKISVLFFSGKSCQRLAKQSRKDISLSAKAINESQLVLGNIRLPYSSSCLFAEKWSPKIIRCYTS